MEHWAQPSTSLGPDEYQAVRSLAESLFAFLQTPAVEERILEVNQPGQSSTEVQSVVLSGAGALGFSSERRGLFAQYHTPQLRPDYYLPLPVFNSGVLLEVERGKTIINNMDLLDFWKTHICDTAHHLFLLVPQRLQQNDRGGSGTRPYAYAAKRLASFFDPRTYTSVRSCWLFGY